VRQRQFAEAREEVHGVAPAHPLARRRRLDETKNFLEILACRSQVPFQHRDIAKVELRVGERLVVATLAAALGGALVELASAVQIPVLDVEPSDRVQVFAGGRV